MLLSVAALGCSEAKRRAGPVAEDDASPKLSLRPVASREVEQREDSAAKSLAGRDWPNWRGPAHDGISRETGWNSDWANRPPKQLWKTNVGTGFSSVSVVGHKLYTMGNRRHGNEDEPHDIVSCLNTDNGDVIWEHAYPCEFSDQYHEGGPGATPTVDGDCVYTVGRRGHLFCLSADDGAVHWSKMLTEDLGVEMPEWGFTCSPMILGDKLIVEAGRTVAYDKTSGRKLWQTKMYRPGYGSPVAFEHAGQTVVAVFNNDALVVLSAANGDVLNEYPWETSYVTTSATPIVHGDKIFISSGYNTGCALLQLESGNMKEVYRNRRMSNHFNNSVLYEGTLYGMDGNSHSARNVRLVAMDFDTGRVHWSERGFGCGSLTIAGDKLLVLSDDGDLTIASASAKQFSESARLDVLDGRCWTVPVLAHQRIYCRSAAGNVVCVDVSN